MTTISKAIHAEICRFIGYNDKDVQIFPTYGLEMLQKKFGDRLIPSLIECLRDGNSEVRQFTIPMLCLAGDESAIPAVIERFDDDDCDVVEIVIYFIRFVGPAAAKAIPRLEPWLDSPNDHLSLLAAMAIVAIDPKRTDMKARIWDALSSKNRDVRVLARLFFGMGRADEFHS